MFEEGAQCPVCHRVADLYEDHNVGCGGNGDHIFCHTTLRDAGFPAAQSAALAPRREMPSLIPNSQSQPADIFLPCWKGDRPAALDVTQQSMIHGNSGFAPVHSKSNPDDWRGKETCYSWGHLQGSWCLLYPVGHGLETLGGMSASAVDTLACLSHFLGQHL